MSALQVVNQGEEAFLDLILAVNYTLRLFQNDVETGLTETQKNALTQAAFTEANFTGYSAAALTGGSWTTTQDDPSTGTYAQQSFTRSGGGAGQLIYGYYLTKTSGGALQWYEQFDGPQVILNGDVLRVTPAITLDEGGIVPTGQITGFGGSSAPTGWQLCDGTAISRTTFAALFAVVGTTYGVGNGTTTFNVPDLRQRFPMGKAASGTGSTLGGTGGAIDHTHSLDSATAHAQVSANSNVFHHNRITVAAYNETVSATGLTTAATTTSQTLGTKLGGSTATANAPFQAVNYIIKT